MRIPIGILILGVYIVFIIHFCCCFSYQADAVRIRRTDKLVSLNQNELGFDLNEDIHASYLDSHESSRVQDMKDISHDDKKPSVLLDIDNWFGEVKEIVENAKNQLNQSQELTDEIASKAYDLCLRYNNESVAVDVNSTLTQSLEEAFQRLKNHTELLTKTLEETLEPLSKELNQRNKTEDTDDRKDIIEELDDLVKRFHQDLRKLIFMQRRSEELIENPTKYLVENDERWCKRNLDKLVTPSSDPKLVSSINKFKDDTAMPSNIILMYVLASLSGTIGLALLMIPPSLGYYSNIMCVFYSFGMIAYAFGFYGFDMTSTIGYTQESYQRVEFAVYAIGALGGTLAAIVPILYSQTHALTITFVGASFGAVLGIQANTLGLYTLSSDPVYFTIALAISGGTFVFGTAWLLIAKCKKDFGPRQTANTFAQCWIGSYLFVKMAGVLAGTYPNEYTLSLPLQEKSINSGLFIGFMIFIGVFVFFIHYCCYRPYAMIEAPRILSASWKVNKSKGKTALDLQKTPTMSSPPSPTKKKSINLHQDEERNRQKQQQQQQQQKYQNQKLQVRSMYLPLPSPTNAPSAPRMGYDGRPMFGGMRSPLE